MSRRQSASPVADRQLHAIETTVRAYHSRSSSSLFAGAVTINEKDNRHLNMCLAPTYPKRFKKTVRPKQHPPRNMTTTRGSSLFKKVSPRS